MFYVEIRYDTIYIKFCNDKKLLRRETDKQQSLTVPTTKNERNANKSYFFKERKKNERKKERKKERIKEKRLID
jgi:hypothetical protein